MDACDKEDPSIDLAEMVYKHVFQTWGGIEKPSKLSQNEQRAIVP